jgi:hypothetical protein
VLTASHSCVSWGTESTGSACSCPSTRCRRGSCPWTSTVCTRFCPKHASALCIYASPGPKTRRGMRYSNTNCAQAAHASACYAGSNHPREVRIPPSRAVDDQTAYAVFLSQFLWQVSLEKTLALQIPLRQTSLVASALLRFMNAAPRLAEFRELLHKS